MAFLTSVCDRHRYVYRRGPAVKPNCGTVPNDEDVPIFDQEMARDVETEDEITRDLKGAIGKQSADTLPIGTVYNRQLSSQLFFLP
ncbi:hypothetical protein M8C21_022144 [Ambrosia artemisiifolia]|uniref:Uncharacterized protein n=1 Tax=Ambrosia artemisiifolia TaxID=4212 RepID=A0AAD5C9Q6_AMBAR|nr:hypothetical protein M8C21_022144 [Ambrosia artemisiifolia]